MKDEDRCSLCGEVFKWDDRVALKDSKAFHVANNDGKDSCWWIYSVVQKAKRLKDADHRND